MGKPFGSMKGTGGGGAGGQAATQGFENFLANGLNQGVFGGGNFGNAINNMLQGQVGDPNSLNNYFANVNNGGNGGLSPEQFLVGAQFAAPQFQNFSPQSPGMANVNAPNWINSPDSARIADSTLNSGFGTTAQLGSAGSADVNGQFGQAVSEILSRKQGRDVADLRARYGATGSGLGSNAQLAESNYRAEALPQVAAALGQINQQERGLNLQQRAQDLQNFQGGRQLDISQMGQMLGNAQLLGNQNLAQNQFNQGNAQLGLQAQGMNMDSIMAMNQLGQNQNQFQNSFNQNNAQFGADQYLRANMFNSQNMLQNQQMQNQYGLGQAQVGLGLQQNQQQAQQYALSQLFNAYMNNQNLNTAQRQQVYQPGWVQNTLGAAGQVAGIAGQFMNPLAGMGSMFAQNAINQGNQTAAGVNWGALGNIGQIPPPTLRFG